MRILITGSTGFVAKHFLDLLNETEPGSEVLGIDKNITGLDVSRYPGLKISCRDIDLLDKQLVEVAIKAFNPEYILHLASVSSVALSWQEPQESFVNNTGIFLNLVEQVRINKIKCRILSVGSSEEYGEVTEEQLPLTEAHPLKPLSPYAVARVSQEMLSRIYADGFGQDIIITRSFNHIGPGQKDRFVIASFAKQLVRLAREKAAIKKIVTGDLNIVRDFLDVRDVVKAYYALLKKGRKGQVYNICSGNGIALHDVIDIMSKQLMLDIELEVDPEKLRPNENKKIIGSYQKIKDEIGWQPSISLEKSLADIIQYWQQQH